MAGILQGNYSRAYAWYFLRSAHGFTYSLDDFIITYFTRGAKFQNLSIEIYSMTHRRISPKINALSALLFLAVLIVMVIINLRDRHEEKVQKKRT